MMEITNQMERLVLDTVNDIFNSKEIQESDICTCSQCRLDVACFVLNRTPAEYIISSRGLAYFQSDYVHNVQKAADVVQLVKKGIEVVSKGKRPGFTHDCTQNESVKERPSHNFPVISGRLFNGQNFEPLADKEIRLFIDGKPAVMVNNNWPNPYRIVSTLPGNYMFMPAPVDAGGAGERRTFSLVIKMDDPEFGEFSHNFELELAAEDRMIDALQANRNRRIQDLYVFKKDYVEEGIDSQEL